MQELIGQLALTTHPVAIFIIEKTPPFFIVSLDVLWYQYYKNKFVLFSKHLTCWEKLEPGGPQIHISCNLGEHLNH